MGPVRGQSEALSAYRFRYALYSAVWAACLAVPMVVIWPYRAGLVGSFLGMFLLFGLPIGVGTALLAMVGFVVGGIFSRYAECSPRSARIAERIKVTLGTLLFAPVGMFQLYLAGRALVVHDIPMFSRKLGPNITLENHPVLFGVLVVVWGGFGAYLLTFFARKLREAYAR